MGKKLCGIVCLVLWTGLWTIVCLTSWSCSAKENVAYNNACVKIVVDNKIFSSGFSINETGYILTAAHSFGALYEENDISVYADMRDEKYQATVISIDFDKDVALLKSNISVSEYIDLDSHSRKNSKNAYVIGYLGGQANTTTKVGVIYEDIRISTDTKTYRGVVLDGDIELGLSGAPVINENGYLIGMVTSKDVDQRRIYALTTAEIREFLLGKI